MGRWWPELLQRLQHPDARGMVRTKQNCTLLLFYCFVKTKTCISRGFIMPHSYSYCTLPCHCITPQKATIANISHSSTPCTGPPTAQGRNVPRTGNSFVCGTTAESDAATAVVDFNRFQSDVIASAIRTARLIFFIIFVCAVFGSCSGLLLCVLS